MTLLELKNDFMSNNIKHFYIFVGSEVGIMNIYLAQLSKLTGYPVTRKDTMAEVYANFSADSLFGSSTGLYVVRDDKDFMKADKSFDNFISDIGDNYVVMLCEKLDSRLKFGKYFKDETVVFEKLSTMVLMNYIKKECDLSERNREILSNKVSNSFDVAMLECDKIRQYAQACGISVDESMKVLLDKGVISSEEQIDVFTWVDSILKRQRELAFKRYSMLRDNGVDGVNMLGTLYNSWKNVLLVTVCEDEDVPNTTGLDSKQVYFASKVKGKYTPQELVSGLKLISQTVSDIKNGVVDEMYSVPYVMCQVL